MSDSITKDLLLEAYCSGIFPMAIPEENDAIYWFSPDPRAIIPLEAYRIPRGVKRAARRSHFATTTDEAFETVLERCSDRAETWISSVLISLYKQLFASGFAHSVESWHGERLVGGLYGVAIGGAFFGESMFHEMTEASNVALADLIGRLIVSGYTLLDTQYLTPHLERFGAVEIDRGDYLDRLAAALHKSPQWYCETGPVVPPNLSA